MNKSIFNYINSLKEDDFSREVIIPLFEEMNYERCTFNGGSWEFGKDLIFTIKAGLEENRVHIQSKILSNCGKQDKYKISHQLSQCLHDGTYNGKGERVRANKVYFIFPEVQKERLSAELFAALPKDDRFEILDGVKIVELIENYAPKLKEALCTTEETYTKNLYLEKTNEELLRSIQARNIVDIQKLYSDLSFYIGSVDSKHFLQFPPIIVDKKIEFDFSSWNRLRYVIEECIRVWKLQLILEDIEDIENKIEAQKLYYTRQRVDIDKDIKQAVIETTTLENDSKTFLTPNTSVIFSFMKNLNENFKEGCQTLLNSSNPSTILQFLKKTRASLEFFQFVEENKSAFNNFFHFKDAEEKEVEHSATNLTLSPFLVFDSKLDIALYGEAGAGKTTTLSQYAKYKIQQDSTSMIYLKLNRIYAKIAEHQSAFKINTKENMLISLVCINSGKNPNDTSIADVKELLIKERTLILDGLDEVHKALPNLLEEIESFKESYPQIQIIISSRDCVSYLNKIRFLGITLEPFSQNQINEFARLYLGELKYNEIKKQLNSKDLLPILRTPLLATVACELFNQGIKSFNNENEIYSCRLRLLTGEYDSTKRVTRLRNHHEHLKSLMTKLAFHMHTNNRRFIDYEQAVKAMQQKIAMDRDKIEDMFSELISEANLLFLNKTTNNLSFGHFRFQEHLTSIAIKTQPHFDWISSINNEFWQGALELYAMENSIEFIFEKLGGRALTSEQKRVLKIIIKKSPLRENKGLIDFVNITYE
ncbi:NACHT domain-containing protein [Alteromonas marina]